MTELLALLEDSQLARLVTSGRWWYPIILSVHAIGMGFLAGLLILIDLRLLNFAPDISLAGLRKYLRLVWAALVLNFGSGVLLFVGNAMSDYYSTAFRIKIALIAVGITVALVLQSTVLKAPDGTPVNTGIPTYARVLAVISLTSWLGAITAGRLIAYLP